MNQEIDRFEAFCKIKGSKGKIFSAEFTKKDNTLRRMVCRLGVKKGVKGIGMSYNPAEKGLIGVFDMQKNEFRMINIKTLHSLRIANAEWIIKQGQEE